MIKNYKLASVVLLVSFATYICGMEITSTSPENKKNKQQQALPVKSITICRSFCPRNNFKIEIIEKHTDNKYTDDRAFGREFHPKITKEILKNLLEAVQPKDLSIVRIGLEKSIFDGIPNLSKVASFKLISNKLNELEVLAGFPGNFPSLTSLDISNSLLWRSEDERNIEKHFDFIMEADITHIFKAKQHRTFDLKGKPLSKRGIIRG